jgi:hypothetical protein
MRFTGWRPRYAPSQFERNPRAAPGELNVSRHHVPTIELISIGCPEVPELPKYPCFAYIAETNLVTHRLLFQNVFDSLTGVIVHLANKDFEGEEDRCWFAGMIMNWDHDEALVFLPETRRDVADLMRRLIAASPDHRITFSTDYQFGGDRQECGEVAFSEFFRLHDAHALRYNRFWYVRADY